MKKTVLLSLALTISSALFANDFVKQFMEQFAEEKRPLSNVNIGKSMLDKMAANTADEQLKKTFSELNSISIVSSDNKKDSRHYFRKAHELIKEAFLDFEEMVSLNEHDSKISVWMKKEDEKRSHLILLSLDEESKFTLITVSGIIDLQSISKLSGALKEEPLKREAGKEGTDKEEQAINGDS